MAQPPQPPVNRPAPGPAKPPPPPPLKDPAEGKSPAIGGGHLAKTGEPAPHDELPPDPPVKTIAELQREHSANIEEMGMQAYHDTGQDFIDSQVEGQAPVVEGVGFKKVEHGR